MHICLDILVNSYVKTLMILMYIYENNDDR